MTFVGLSIIIMRLGFQSVRVEDEVIYCSTTVGLETRVGRVCDKCAKCGLSESLSRLALTLETHIPPHETTHGEFILLRIANHVWFFFFFSVL